MWVALLAIKSGNLLNLDEVQRFMAWEGITSRTLGAHQLPVIDLDQFLQKALKGEHLIDEGLYNVIRCSAVIGCLEIGEGGLLVAR